jgi:bifunctional non-homologous end joining protein LigD
MRGGVGRCINGHHSVRLGAEGANAGYPAPTSTTRTEASPLITHVDLAQLVSAYVPFDRDGWVFELKYDGFRMLAAHGGDRAELVSRGGRNFADRFPEIAFDLLDLPEVIIDGELVMLNADGRSDFERLVARSRLKRAISITHAARTTPVFLYAFDLIECDGVEFRQRPLVDRKSKLKELLSNTKCIRYAEHIERQGVMLFKIAEEIGLEGIVAKRANASYPRGGRSKDWVKIKTSHGRHIDEERAKWNER